MHYECMHKHSRSNYSTDLELNRNGLENQFSTEPIREPHLQLNQLLVRMHEALVTELSLVCCSLKIYRTYSNVHAAAFERNALLMIDT